jgi:hypothetical protein
MLSFQVRNPVYDERGNVIRNLFVFDGLIRSNAIEGILKCRPAITNEPCANDQKVLWKEVKLKNTEMHRIGNRQDWETLVTELLKCTAPGGSRDWTHGPANLPAPRVGPMTFDIG